MTLIHATNETFDTLVLAASKPVVVDFWADWSPRVTQFPFGWKI